jgi:ABC-type uncharacterized transport system involved in gliding motility auxiliary subunit
MLDLLDQFVVQIETEEALDDRYIILVIDPQLQKFYAHGPLPAVLAMKTLECLRADFDKTEDCADLQLQLVPCWKPSEG